MEDILIINGPNLNKLGGRDQAHYGTKTLDDIMQEMFKRCANYDNISLLHYQSNVEGYIVDKIQQYSSAGVKYAILNLGAYTHTSVAIRDALTDSKLKFIEVHLSNVDKRESFRKNSMISDIAVGVISGLGEQSYYLALDYFYNLIQREDRNAR